MAAGVTHAAAGRDELIARAERALAQRGCALVGPAGIGKTYTAHLLAERLATSAEVVWIFATQATADVPLGAFAAFLPATATDVPAIVLARAALAERAAGRRLVLVVDDAHALDEASAALVHHLAIGGEATVLITQRSGTPAPDPVMRLWRDHTIERIDLDGLDVDAIAELVTAVLGAPVEPASAAAVWSRTGGNPLFARELVLAGRAGSEWVLGNDGLRWRAGEAAAPRLADLLGDRLAALPDEHRQALAHLAFGEPLGLAELTRITTEDVIGDLERDGLITAELDGRRVRVRFAHPLHGEVVRRATTPLRARAVRATLANVLAAVIGNEADANPAHRRDDELRLAALALDAGVDVDADVFSRAAAVASLGDDGDLTVRLADEAFRRRPTFSNGRVLADALVRFGELDDARFHWAAWAAVAADAGESQEVAHHRAGGEFRRGASTDLTGLADLPAVRAELLAQRGRFREAGTIAAPGSPMAALALVTGGHAETALAALAADDVRGHAVRAAALAALGRLDEALDTAAAAAAAARDAGDRTAAGIAELFRADVFGMLGRPADGLAAVGAAEQAFHRRDHATHRARALAVRAWLASVAGDAEAARGALARLDGFGPFPGLAGEWAPIARAWLADDPASLAEVAAELAGQGDVFAALRTHHAAIALGEPPNADATALARSAQGPLSAALVSERRVAREALARLGAAGLAGWPGGTSAAPGDVAAAPLAPLTRREREVALLAAQGLPARTIGERLFLSARTVENHLNRAYDKLGIRSRAALAQLLAPAS